MEMNLDLGANASIARMSRELPRVYDADANAGGCDLSLPSDVNKVVGSESFMMMPFFMMIPFLNKSSHTAVHWQHSFSFHSILVKSLLDSHILMCPPCVRQY